MRLYIIRHGETPWNRQRKLQGRTDIPLNEFGESLARVTGQALAEVPFDLCIVSPLTRTRQTALQVLGENKRFQQRRKEAGLSDFQPVKKPYGELLREDATGFPLLADPRIIEINFGSWEGLGCGVHNMEIPCENFQDFFRDPDLLRMPEGAETAADVKARTADFLRELTETRELSDKQILIACHGFAIRAMLNPFYEDPGDFWQGHPPYNCAVNILETDGEGKLQLVDRDRIYYDPKLAANFYGGKE